MNIINGLQGINITNILKMKNWRKAFGKTLFIRVFSIYHHTPINLLHFKNAQPKKTAMTILVIEIQNYNRYFVNG